MNNNNINELHKKVWTKNRVQSPLSIATILFFLFYSPVGLVLMITRMVFYFTFFLPLYAIFYWLKLEKIYIAITWPIIGLWCQFSNKDQWQDNKNGMILISNHISDFDAPILWRLFLPSTSVAVSNQHWQKIYRVLEFFKFPAKVIFLKNNLNKQNLTDLKLKTQQYIDKGKKIIVFPEGLPSIP